MIARENRPSPIDLPQYIGIGIGIGVPLQDTFATAGRVGNPAPIPALLMAWVCRRLRRVVLEPHSAMIYILYALHKRRYCEV